MRLLVVACAVCALALPVYGSQPAPDADFSFVVLGHLRGNANGESYPELDELVARARSLEPDLVFLTGDSIWGDYHAPRGDRAALELDWQRLDAELARIGAPIHRVPGNHDINDPVTRDVYFARYGRPPQALEYGGSLFLLLNSTHVPEGDQPAELPRRYARMGRLPDDQLAFLREWLARADAYEHVFVLVHHTLWWEPGAPWWQDVHPLLVAAGVSAVFSGDYGPLKFSHVQRDDIDYVQSSVEGEVDVRILQDLHSSRVLSYQLDTFLHVAVRGADVEIDVIPVGALTSGKFTPERFAAVHSAERGLARRTERALGGPVRRTLLALALLGSFALGVVVALRLGPRR